MTWQVPVSDNTVQPLWLFAGYLLVYCFVNIPSFFPRVLATSVCSAHQLALDYLWLFAGLLLAAVLSTFPGFLPLSALLTNLPLVTNLFTNLPLVSRNILLPATLCLSINHGNISTHISFESLILHKTLQYWLNERHCFPMTFSMSNLYFQAFSLAKDIWEDVVEIFECRFNYIWNIFNSRPDIREISSALQEINSFCDHKFCSNPNWFDYCS